MTAPIETADFATPFPAVAGWEPPTLDDLGLTADPVAIALNVLGQLTDEQLAAVLGYYQPPKLRAVA